MQLIDLHCHILPGIDDGARDMSISLEMARMAVADGISVTACTSHITPGIFDNDAFIIDEAVSRVQHALDENNIKLELVTGADIRVTPDLAERLSEGTYPSIGNSSYFLFEPSHHVLPPRMVNLAIRLIDIGYIPVLTHPERLTWIEHHYDVVEKMDEAGCVIQITAGAITGNFGKQPRYWSERMLDEGRVDIIASDAHNLRSRPPVLSRAREAVAERLGERAAMAMVYDHPLMILKNQRLPQKRRRKVAKKPSGMRGTSIGGKIFQWVSARDRRHAKNH